MSELKDKLISKIKTLSDTVWDGKATNEEVENWLRNFNECEGELAQCERTHALYLLSQFMYFSSREIRELIKSMYRDLLKYPLIERIRKNNNDTREIDFINNRFMDELKKTRFLAVGNPSESGAHLLYYFRQENRLSRKLFISAHEIFNFDMQDALSLQGDGVHRYVFIDDFCGGGTQAARYLGSIVDKIKKLKPEVEVEYYVLFANVSGLKYLKTNTAIDRCDAVFKLDDSYKCFGVNSRHKPKDEFGLDWAFAQEMAAKYGSDLYKSNPLGHADNQLLIGLFHNTPNNTLPIFWFEDRDNSNWEPIFRRYPKVYGGL